MSSAVLEPEVDVKVSDEERFLFDLQGYIVLRGVLSPEEIARYLGAVRRLEGLRYDERERLKHTIGGKTAQPTLDEKPGHKRLNGLLRLDLCFDELIDHPAVFPRVRAFMELCRHSAEPQLVNTWSIAKAQGHDHNGWHRGITPDLYGHRAGKLGSRMLNTIWFLTDNGPDDGCVIAVPGSHKNHIDLNWGSPEYHGLKMPGSQCITGRAGDVLLFSEALLHTGLKKTTPGLRTNLYYNYITLDFAGHTYSPEHNYHFVMPPSIRRRFTPRRQAATRWMETAVSIDIPPFAVDTP
ncbi:MAG: hypothetical protein AMXMBFR7_20870 [Planctomycetota bacterium]